MKLTKRKAFNFLRSYFDVLNELKEDSDKLDFLMSIINKQFLDQDPKELGFIANLCYESQRHAIEKSVKGWITANKTDLEGNPTPPIPLPPIPPKGSPLPLPPKEEQVQEEVEEKEEVKKINGDIDFIYSLYPTKCLVKNSNTGKSSVDKRKIEKLLKTISKDKLSNTIERYKKDCVADKIYMKNFGTFLNNLPDYDSKEVDPNKLDEDYVYYQWMNDPTTMARRVLKSEADKMFEGQAMGGYKPKLLKSLKGKNTVWK
jgi:hypothetical protein